ncbi:hypothetical protein [Nostoc sp. MS1]|uniref:hypothetical protein n=1 Tax=Nostoc sp. MS1 TaxID=2764711 RepID=UPI001CC448E4|nr:hypothetical protein [Nostoc sp. MS1]BCL36667.1 hypothetical protein NSMS1_31140 [Nostoc sp. MS1]
MVILIICLLGLVGFIFFIKDALKQHNNKSNYYFNETTIGDSNWGFDSAWELNNQDSAFSDCDGSDSSSCDGGGD